MEDQLSDGASKQAEFGLAFETAVAQSPADSRPAGRAPASPWRMPREQVLFFGLALGAAALVLLLRLVLLGSIQNDPYGDIEIVYTYATSIQAGEWPFHFVLSAGPLYNYTIAPIVAITGLSYYGLKLAAVIVSLGVLAATYALGRQLIDDYFALLATVVAGVSCWLLIWSRLGNSQIIVPLLTTAALWLAARVAQHGRTADVVACAVVSALGLYAYPQSFVLPGVVLITLLGLRWAGWPIAWARLGLFALVAAACALPFGLLVLRDPYNFIGGYIGGKIAAPANPLAALLHNLASAALAFHVRGDSSFRSNPSKVPHLDVVSGVLLLGGVLFWLRRERRRWAALLLVPFVLLQLPSALVLAFPEEVPSASRTLGAAPIAYVLVASGLWWLARAAGARGWRWLGLVAGAVLLAAIVGLNAERYFNQYIRGLPYGDTSINAEIAQYVGLLPAETNVYIVGCCWESNMPVTRYAQIALDRPRDIQELEPRALTCDQLRFMRQPTVLIWSFHDASPAPQMAACAQWLPAQLFADPRGQPLFHAAPVRVDQANQSLPDLPPPPVDRAGEQLEYTTVEVGGQPIGVRFSPLDIGTPADIFDGSRDTLARGRDANPLVIELRFSEPRTLRSIGLDLGTMSRVQVKLEATVADGSVARAEREYQNLPSDPHIDLALASDATRVLLARVEITDMHERPADGFHIHVRELKLQP